MTVNIDTWKVAVVFLFRESRYLYAVSMKLILNTPLFGVIHFSHLPSQPRRWVDDFSLCLSNPGNLNSATKIEKILPKNSPASVDEAGKVIWNKIGIE